MTIKYSKKHLRTDLAVGSLYLIGGIIGFIYNSNSLIKYGFTSLGLLYLGTFFYKVKFDYISIDECVLTTNIPGSKKKIDLSDLTRIRKLSDEIILFTLQDKLKIHIKFIRKEDLPKLENFLASLELEPENNPFLKAS